VTPPPYAVTRTLKVVILNSETRQHLIEALGDWKAKQVRESGRALLCGQKIVNRSPPNKETGASETPGDKIRVGGLGNGAWCNACLAASARGVIAP
jgi:hypothetical protein